VIWTALLLVPVLALAQSPYEGIYFGTYQGEADDGEFALIVNDRGYGTLAAYDAVDDTGYIENNIYVRADGSFQFVTLQGVHIEGQATATDISGRYFDAGSGGSFTGWRESMEGPLQDAAGYYSGPASIVGAGPWNDNVIDSRMVSIIAADGSAFLLLGRTFAGPAGLWPGDFDYDYDYDYDFDFDFDFDLDLGFGFDLDLDYDINPPFHRGFRFNPPFHTGFGSCGPFQPGHWFGWPFNFGFDYSFRVSFLGSVDLDFSFNLPTCRSYSPWNRFPVPGVSSGGLAQIEPDGNIQATLLDGLALQGSLDPEAGSAEGILFQQQGATSWSGHWEIELRDNPSGLQAAKQFNRLSDVNGDGNADILWRHAVSGNNAVWLMEGSDIEAELPLEIQWDPDWDSQWALTDVYELNDDQQPDLLWRHPLTGEIFLWLSGDVAPVFFELDPAWQIVGSGDFDADARPEILVRHSGTGANALIVDLPGQAALAPFPAMEDHSWSPVAVADFDGDSYPDVLWVNPHSSDLLIWLMAGQTLASELHLTPENPGQYELAGVGDFDGDGSTDILWRDYVSGIARVTLATIGNGAEDPQLGANVAREWQVGGVGDLDGDGTDDLIWRHRVTGENKAWLIVDSQVADTAALKPAPDLHWTIQP
jgi:hypothetical protein